MSAFDIQVNVAAINVALVKDNPENPDEQATSAELALGLASFFPVGPGQFQPIPFGTVRAPLDKVAIDNLIAQLQEASDQMKERSKIEIANDVSQAEALANATAEVKSKLT